MKPKSPWIGIAAALVIGSTTAIPAISFAMDPKSSQILALNRDPEQQSRRQKFKNDWRNLALAGGILAALGLLTKDSTVTFVGAAGGLYSLYRYEQDRKSQNRVNRARAEVFSHKSFTRNGVRYERKLVTKKGKKYYQFVKAR